ncbi:MAG: T9SS type A sorting domain-containing protein [Flavobacteriales bacterium]|nr:T9SS type A sorting domain-containing protein [Flavobacteriales bacterium]
MKNLLLISAVLVSLSAFSQSISVEAHTTEVDPTCCTTLIGDIGTEITVRNTTNSSIEISVSRQTLNQTLGTENYFCWTSCYGSQTSVSPQSKLFSPQEVDQNSFQVHYDNKGYTPASASVKYCAFVTSNPSDSACTIVNYTVGITSVEDNFSTVSFSEFHPNPTSSIAFLDYNLDYSDVAEIVVTDMLGNVIRKENISSQSGTLKFDVSNTKAGLYFANISVNGELKTIKRLVVSK